MKPRSAGAAAVPAPALPEVARDRLLRRSSQGQLGEEIMAVTLPLKRAVFWALGIIAGLTLTTFAWSQINETLCRCLSFL